MRNVIIYGKDGCSRCIAAKEKFEKFNIKYKYEEAYKFITEHSGWRNDASLDVMAFYQQKRELPIIHIDGAYYTYSVAMKLLKKSIRK